MTALGEPRRKPNRLPAGRYRGKQFFFVTICVQERKPVFSDARLVAQLSQVLTESCMKCGFGLYAYCFMPDHVHIEVVGLQDAANLQELVRAFKGVAARVARDFRVRNLWQKGFYDHILRSSDAQDDVAWYIFSNPVRAGLIVDWSEWPYSGSSLLKWKQLREPMTSYIPSWKKA